MRPPTGARPAARDTSHSVGLAAAPGDDERGTRAHSGAHNTRRERAATKPGARPSRRELLSMANSGAGWYEWRRGRPPVRRSGGRVVSALFFFPRGGSAQVARALSRAGAASADVLHLHHLTPANEAALRAFPAVPVVGQLHGTELALLRAIEAG